MQKRPRPWAKIVARVGADEAFKNKLKADPVAVLRAEAANLGEVELKERLAATWLFWCRRSCWPGRDRYYAAPAPRSWPRKPTNPIFSIPRRADEVV